MHHRRVGTQPETHLAVITAGLVLQHLVLFVHLRHTWRARSSTVRPVSGACCRPRA